MPADVVDLAELLGCAKAGRSRVAWRGGEYEIQGAARRVGSEVELIFEGDDGTPVVHLLAVKPAGKRFPEGVMVVNGYHVFWGHEHRKEICRLAADAQRVAAQTFLAGETVKRLAEEARAARQAAWDATH